MKDRYRCDECGGRLGLGVRFRNLWNGWSWSHLRFCGTRCEEKNESMRTNANRETRWLVPSSK